MAILKLVIAAMLLSLALSASPTSQAGVPPADLVLLDAQDRHGRSAIRHRGGAGRP